VANPLDGGPRVSPPAPNPDAGRSGSNFNALTGGNALMVPQRQQQMPAPDHQQTCAALHHCMTIVDELQKLKKNPSLGRSNIKGVIIDGVSDLVARRMISPANAVPLLAGVPEDPIAQRKWTQQMLQQTVDAQEQGAPSSHPNQPGHARLGA
jgi:hypothetical protein